MNTVLSGFLATPGIGQGIYDREGVTAGQSYTRTYTFTRTSGGGGAVNVQPVVARQRRHVQRACDDRAGEERADAARRSRSTRPRPGSTRRCFASTIPAGPGSNTRRSNVVIAADQFTAGNNYSVTKSGTIGRNQTRSFFFRVPAGTPAFKVDFSGPSATPGTGQARFLRFHPYGVAIDSNASTSCYSPPPSRGGSCGNPNSRTTSNPQAGVWEITVEGRRTSDAADIPFTLTASILGATVSPNPDTIASATIGVPIARSYTMTNVFGAFTGRAVGTSLGSARLGQFSIAHLAQQQYADGGHGGVDVAARDDRQSV